MTGAGPGGPPRLGLRPNAAQFSLLVLVNALVGAMVGLERTVLPLLAREQFGIASASAALSFIAAFGLAKSLSNLAAGRLADAAGRRRLLIAGWLAALPVAPLLLWAPSWGWVVAANVLLGVNQGLAWSATVIMKVDLVGPARRGLALGLNEAAGYGAVALAAWVTGLLAAAHGARTAPFVLGIAISVAGLVLSAGFARETGAHAREEARQYGRGGGAQPFSETFALTSFRHRSLSAVSQAGFVNNLNDGMAWGLLPVYLAAHGLGVSQIGAVVAVYPASWGLAQLATGPWSDRVGRKPLIVAGMWVQGLAILALLAAGGFGGWLLAALGMGLGTALVYPTLIAAVGDIAHPGWRASAVGVYRLWRDLGFVAGALAAGVLTDLAGAGTAIAAVAVLTLLSGGVVAARMQESLDRRTVELASAP